MTLHACQKHPLETPRVICRHHEADRLGVLEHGYLVCPHAEEAPRESLSFLSPVVANLSDRVDRRRSATTGTFGIVACPLCIAGLPTGSTVVCQTDVRDLFGFEPPTDHPVANT